MNGRDYVEVFYADLDGAEKVERGTDGVFMLALLGVYEFDGTTPSYPHAARFEVSKTDPAHQELLARAKLVGHDERYTASVFISYDFPIPVELARRIVNQYPPFAHIDEKDIANLKSMFRKGKFYPKMRGLK